MKTLGLLGVILPILIMLLALLRGIVKHDYEVFSRCTLSEALTRCPALR